MDGGLVGRKQDAGGSLGRKGEEQSRMSDFTPTR